MKRIIEFFTKEDQDKKLIRKMKEYEIYNNFRF